MNNNIKNTADVSTKGSAPSSLGPAGKGKSAIVKQMAAELKRPLYDIRLS